MEYKYCLKTNFEDLASGRVIYGNEGIPNFPVRLINEIYRRCLEYKTLKENLTIYDPCCGGGYLLTVLGFCNELTIKKLIGSDIDESMIKYARKNIELITHQGLDKRINEIECLIEQYNKQSHIDAKRSALNLKTLVKEDKEISVFQADCTKTLPDIGQIDIIITDIPYGNLVSWKDDSSNPLNQMLERLAEISNTETILALSMDKKQKINSSSWERLEKQSIGKRKFEILKKA